MKYLGAPQSGSQANTTASHNRAGQYYRNRRKPVSPTRTPKQGIQRGRFGMVAGMWQTLTTELQNAWTAFAHSYPVVDALGQTVVLTGQQYFIGLNSSLLACGVPVVTDVPDNVLTPPVDSPLLYLDEGGTVIVSVNSVNTGDFNPVGLSGMLSNGVNFNKNFSQFAVLKDPAVVADVSAVYAAQYGAPVATKKVFARFKEVNSSGMSGPAVIVQKPVQQTTLLPTPLALAVAGGTSTITWAGGKDFQVALFVVTADDEPAYSQAPGVSHASPVTERSLTAGTRYYVRLTDGDSWSLPSNIVTMLA